MNTQLSDQVREQLQRLIAIVLPYSVGAGQINDVDDLKTALRLAGRMLERAVSAANKMGRN